MQSSFRSNRIEEITVALLPPPPWIWGISVSDGDRPIFRHCSRFPQTADSLNHLKTHLFTYWSGPSCAKWLMFSLKCFLAHSTRAVASSLVRSHLLLGLSWSTSSPRGPGTEEGPGLFLSSKHWGSLIAPALCAGASVHHDEREKFRYSISPIGSNLRVRLYTDFWTEIISTTLLKPAKLPLSVFSSFEEEFLSAFFSPALLATWGLISMQIHLHLCYDEAHLQTHLPAPLPAKQWIKHMEIHGSTDDHIAKLVFWKVHCPFSFPSSS